MLDVWVCVYVCFYSRAREGEKERALVDAHSSVALACLNLNKRSTDATRESERTRVFALRNDIDHGDRSRFG